VLRFLIQRWLLLVPTLALASLLIFAIVTLAPGDPVRAKLGTEATPQQVAAERARLGLDQPIPVRYAVWLSDVVHLNLGRSLINGRPVTTLITDAFPNTLRLALTAFVLSLAIGIPLGTVAAVHRNSQLDALITSLTSLGLAVPAFWLGMMLILLFAVTLQILPPSGLGTPGQPWYVGLEFLVLPMMTIAVSNISVIARFVRSAMLDTLGADYVRTARAKGVGESTVLSRHALRNALIPVVTVLGIQFGRLLGGAVVTEAVFAYPGLGFLVVSSIQNRDYPVVQGTLMLVVAIFLLTSMLVDLSYAYIDPRVTLQGHSR
jgi:ABC-type dipeptide/oligopeptide/nickel transport system permease component